MTNSKSGTLNMKNFTDVLLREVHDYMDPEMTVRIVKISKPNREPEQAMVFAAINMDETLSPAIYIRPLYDEYICGKSVHSLAAESIRTCREQSNAFNFDIRLFTDLDLAIFKITCRVINYESNRELLKQIPYREYLGLALVLYYEIDDSHSILIRDTHVDMWGTDMDNDSLFTIALSNTRRLYPAKIIPFTEVLDGLIGNVGSQSEDGDEPKGLNLFVLSNERLLYGAVNLLYDDVLAAACRQTGSNKIYILPSSVHEVIIIPADNKNGFKITDPHELKQIVQAINAKYVDQEDILGDYIYSFSISNSEKKLVIEA